MPPRRPRPAHARRDRRRVVSGHARPRFHYAPPTGWLNDPNGLVFHGGEYHLFFQHNPDADVWGAMHWGHAVSRDLVHWEDLPTALHPDELGWIYSGSAVVDHDDTAGLGRDAMVAVFTHASASGQAQSLASSCDHGRTWRAWSGNPVLLPPAGEPDFRDPKVFRWEADGNGHWVMVLAAGRRVLLYTSPDLHHWELSDEVTPDLGSPACWETPDLFPLPVEGRDDVRWVLSLGVMAGAPAGGTGTCYLVGDFDGRTFRPDPGEVSWADHGPDFYAAQSWNGLPSNERIWIAWMANWLYADRVPSGGWRGMMTVARRLGLRATADGFRLTQTPIVPLDTSREARLSLGDVVLPARRALFDGVRSRCFDLTLRIRVDRSTARRFELRTRVGVGEATSIAYDLTTASLSLDRSHAGAAAFHAEHPRSPAVKVGPREGALTLRVLGDESSVEVFADDGTVALTALVYPEAGSDGLGLEATGGSLHVEKLELFDLGV